MIFTKFLLIIVAAAVLILLWMLVGLRHLKFLKKEVLEQWEKIDEELRKRHDLIPNIIETIRMFTKAEEELVTRIIKERILAAKEYKPNAEKISYEYDVTHSINELFNLDKKYPDLSLDTNYLELRKEIDDLENNIEDRTRVYNDMVRQYNGAIKKTAYMPLAKIFGFGPINIFEVEK